MYNLNSKHEILKKTIFKQVLIGIILLIVGLFVIRSASLAIASAVTERVSVSSAGEQGNNDSVGGDISYNGSYVVFHSAASNLVPNDTNGLVDVLLYDRITNTTELISVDSSGNQTIGGGSQLAKVSDDGRYVVFESFATNLVPNDTNGQPDVFLRDRLNGTTERISIGSFGEQSNNIAFRPDISADGRYVVFESLATNLVPNDTNSVSDIFIRDLVLGTTELISVDSSGNHTTGGDSVDVAISDDGRYVVFRSNATNLVSNDTNGTTDIFLRDRLNGTTELSSVGSFGNLAYTFSSTKASISADDRYLVYRADTDGVPGDTNGVTDIYMQDFVNGTTEIISVNSSGNAVGGHDPTISGDGQHVVFSSRASNLVANDTNGANDVFVRSFLRNQPPTANAGQDQNGNEGSVVTLDGSGSSDPDGDPLTYSWNFGDGATGSGSIVTHTYSDNGVYTATLTVTDTAGASSSDTATITVNNVAPAVGEITAPLDPQNINTIINAGANFTDPGILDTHTAIWDWGDGNTSTGTVSEVNGSGSVTGSHIYTVPGVYTLTLTVTDKDGSSGSSAFQYVVIYDPNGGFVTGGGWIDSPAGAYTANPTLAGKANFGFNSKYQKGATVPTGQTQFNFKVANFNFHGDVYDWLVVSGPKAQFKGSGTVNGSGDYGFMLTSNDGMINGGGGIDKFRLKVWDKATGNIVYDNQLGDNDDADASTALGGGNVIIHN